MIFQLALGAALVRPVFFPLDPIEFEVRRGVQAYQRGDRLEGIYDHERQVLGWWSDGMQRRGVEEAIWLSPRLMSRWLGFLDAQEKWPADERKRRWNALRAELQGRIVVIVRLAAYPRIGALEGEPVDRADVRALGPLRFMATVDGMAIPSRPPVEFARLVRVLRVPGPAASAEWPRTTMELCVGRLASVQVRRRETIDHYPWVAHTPLMPWLLPEFAEVPRPAVTPRLGEYFADWYWVEAIVDPDQPPRRQFEIRIFSARRERIATFDLWQR